MPGRKFVRHIQMSSKAVFSLLAGTILLAVLTMAIRPNNNRVFRGDFKGHYSALEVQGYASFDYQNQRLWHNRRDEAELSQKVVIEMMHHYHRKNFQRGPQFSVEIYRHSSLHAIAYIIYKKVSLSQWELYYSVRNREKPEEVHYMGKKTSSGEEPGRNMPFFDYKEVDGPQEEREVSNAVQRQLQAFSLPNDKQIGSWVFPEGKLFSVSYRLLNGSELVVGLLKKNTSYEVMGYSVAPRFEGNMALDYSQLNSYMWHGMMTAFQGDRHVDQGEGKIVYFEYIMDPDWQEVITVRMVIMLEGIRLYYPNPVRNPKVTIRNEKFMEIFMQLYLVRGSQIGSTMFESNRKRLSLDQYFVQLRVYAQASQNQYHVKGYFNNDNWDERMSDFDYGSQLEGRVISVARRVTSQLGVGGKAKGWCIRLPPDTMARQNRHYQLCSSEIWCQASRQTIHIYALFDINSGYMSLQFHRSLHRTYPFNSVEFKDSQEMVKRQYEYVRELKVSGLMIGNAYVSISGEYCPLPDTFQIGIYYDFVRHNNKPRWKMVLLLSHRTSQHVVAITEILLSEHQFERYVPINHHVKAISMCSQMPQLNPQISTLSAQLLTLLIDRQGDQYESSEIRKVLQIDLAKFSQGSLWLVQVVKNGEEGFFVIRLNQRQQYEGISYFITKQAPDVESQSGQTSPLPSPSVPVEPQPTTVDNSVDSESGDSPLPAPGDGSFPIIGGTVGDLSGSSQELTFLPLQSVDSQVGIKHVYERILSQRILLPYMQVDEIEKAVFPNGTFYYHLNFRNNKWPRSRQNFSIIFDLRTRTTLYRHFETYTPPTAESYLDRISQLSKLLHPSLQDHKWFNVKNQGHPTNYTFTLKYLTEKGVFVTQEMAALIQSNQVQEVSYEECPQSM